MERESEEEQKNINNKTTKQNKLEKIYHEAIKE